MKSSANAMSKPRSLRLKSTTIVEIVSALFILLFLYTAINKSFSIGNTLSVLKKTPFFKQAPELIGWSVVVAEYVATILLLIPKTKKLGLYLSLGLMSSFIIYIVAMMIFVPDLPCTCGGVISKMSWTQHLVFNIFFVILALLGIYQIRKQAVLASKEAQNDPIVFT